MCVPVYVYVCIYIFVGFLGLGIEIVAVKTNLIWIHI